ncbi:MAG: hypothetical protein Q9169_004185 [Polycauliona sp. 2 TL-2023]
MDHTQNVAAAATLDEWDKNYEYQKTYLISENNAEERACKVYIEETAAAPLFSPDVAKRVCASAPGMVFPQYGLLAAKEHIHDLTIETDLIQDGKDIPPAVESDDNRIFLNVHAPFSAFICGSQGSGKSYTLSRMLEASLLESPLGKLSHPMTGLLFHWDRLMEPCEAAYLCSAGIEVTVLVSPFNYENMKEKYENLRKLLPGSQKPTVKPLLLRQRHLDVSRMMKLMAIDTKSERPPLYMELVRKTIQEVGRHRNLFPNQFYTKFKASMPKLNTDQGSGLAQRLSLLERFLDGLLDGGEESLGYIHGAEPMPWFGANPEKSVHYKNWKKQQRRKREGGPDIWSFKPGTLTIVDLSDPLSDEYSACTLFDICLGLFLEHQSGGSTIIGLDEAHKYMSGGDTSAAFTESLLSVIRLQRHYGTRVIISTQEPTISPKLLDLCSMSIVHRFTSPEWMLALKGHLAAVSELGDGDPQRNLKEIFKTIVELEPGQALLFSPSAVLDVRDVPGSNAPSRTVKAKKLGLRYVKMRVRLGQATDGGKSKTSA